MSDITIDCKGLSCPQPVIKCKVAIEQETPESLSIIVDNEPAKENVSRFMSTKGYTPSVETDGSNFIVTGTRNGDQACPACEVMSQSQLEDVAEQKIMVFISSGTVGSGDDELGSKLMHNFILTLKELGNELWRIVMVNGGVKLATEGSNCLDDLKELEANGVSILVCGTCLEFYGLTAKRGVGDVTNMLDIVTSFQLATKTIQV